jgi:hypothetical protein
MTRPLLTFAAVASLTLLGAAPPHQLPPCLHTPFEGITQTDPNGNVIGEPDEHDWGCVDRGGGSAAPGAASRAGSTRSRTATADEGVTGLGVPVPPPTSVCMYPAAPNPANAGTRLQFALPSSAHVMLRVYSRSKGHGPRETAVVRELLDTNLAAGQFTLIWDLTDGHGNPLPPGIYRVVLIVGDEALCGDIEIQ